MVLIFGSTQWNLCYNAQSLRLTTKLYGLTCILVKFEGVALGQGSGGRAQFACDLVRYTAMDEKKALMIQSRSCQRKNYCPCIPARYVLAAMSSLGFAIVYALRVNLSVAIVQMDNDTATVHAGSAKVSILVFIIAADLGSDDVNFY